MFSGDVAILDCLLRQYSGQFLDETELGPILSDDVSVSPVNASHDVGGGGGIRCKFWNIFFMDPRIQIASKITLLWSVV